MSPLATAPRRRVVAAAVLALAVSPAAGVVPAHAASPLHASLTFDVTAGAAHAHRRISCPSDGPAVCAGLSVAVARGLLSPMPAAAGEDEYGGPAVARINGTIGRRSVHLRLDRTNTRRIAQWDALRDLLGFPLTLVAP